MQVNFKFEMGEFVNMKIDKSKEEYMIVTLIHENGGNQYKIFSGEPIVTGKQIGRAHV